MTRHDPETALALASLLADAADSGDDDLYDALSAIAADPSLLAEPGGPAETETPPA